MTGVGSEALRVAFVLFDALDTLGVRYQLGGSFASSIHGEPRQTLDVDVVAELRPEHATRLVAALGDRFYVDSDRIRHALAAGSSFNLLHLASGIKIDVFAKGGSSFDDDELERSELVELGDASRRVPVKSAEDTVLRKLLWFRDGGETSERQWRDVLGVLRTQGDRLDRRYLDRQAESLGLVDLLTRAQQEAGPGDAP